MTKPIVFPYTYFITLDSGEKIFPEEIEEAYTKIAPIKEMCVLIVSPVKNIGKSKMLWAIIQPDLDHFRAFDEINLRFVLKERFDNVSLSLPSYKRLEGFTITLDNLPHTSLGKLERNIIKKVYEPRVAAGIEGALPLLGELSATDLLLMKSAIGVKILKCLKNESDIKRPIHLSDSLELDLGIDSLGRVKLTSCLELAFSAEIKIEIISKAFTVRDLMIQITDALQGAKDISLEDQEISLGPGYWKELLHVPPDKETLAILELGTGYVAWLFRFVLTAIDCVIFKLFFRIKADGAENVPREGAYILYGNHTSFLDGPAIGACLPRRPVFQIFYFVFGPYFFRPFVKSHVLRNFVKMGRFIPFDYSTYFVEALRSAYYVLQHGKGLCFFPEGLRSPTGEIGIFKKGFGVLAKESGAKLVPVAILGAHEAWPSTSKHPKYHQIKLRFGKSLLIEDLERQGFAMGSANSYDAICVAARKELIDLKNRQYS